MTTDREFCTVYLPAPGQPCLNANGASLQSPSGENIPHVSDIQISAKAGEYVEVTIKMLARVEQAEG